MQRHHRYIGLGILFIITGAVMMISPSTRGTGAVFFALSAVWFAQARKSKTPPPSEPPTPPAPPG